MSTQSGKYFQGKLTDYERDNLLLRIARDIKDLTNRVASLEAFWGATLVHQQENTEKVDNYKDLTEDLGAKVTLVEEHILMMPKDTIGDRWPGTSIFHTDVKCEDQVVKLIKEGGSCANVVSQALVDKVQISIPKSGNLLPLKAIGLENLRKECLVDEFCDPILQNSQVHHISPDFKVAELSQHYETNDETEQSAPSCPKVLKVHESNRHVSNEQTAFTRHGRCKRYLVKWKQKSILEITWITTVVFLPP